MWYDTVGHGHGHVPAGRCALESLGADRLLLGTDFPFEAGELFVRAIDYVSASGIPAEQATAILDTHRDRAAEDPPRGARERHQRDR